MSLLAIAIEEFDNVASVMSSAAATAASSDPVSSSTGVLEIVGQAATTAGVSDAISPALYSSAASAQAAVHAAGATMSGGGVLASIMDFLQKLLNINWSSPSWDVFIILFFVITVFLYGLSLGRDRIVVILVSTYMALAVVAYAPAIGEGNYAIKATTFLGIFLLLFFLVSRSALKNIFGELGSGSLWQVLVFSVLQVGLLISVTLSFLPPDASANLHEVSQWLFASELGRFGWITVPILAMVLIGRSEK